MFNFPVSSFLHFFLYPGLLFVELKKLNLFSCVCKFKDYLNFRLYRFIFTWTVSFLYMYHKLLILSNFCNTCKLTCTCICFFLLRMWLCAIFYSMPSVNSKIITDHIFTTVLKLFSTNVPGMSFVFVFIWVIFFCFQKWRFRWQVRGKVCG